MAARQAVLLTRGAEQDLEALHAWLAENRSPEHAGALLDDLLAVIGTLETFPERGNVPKELAALGTTEFRQLLVLPYRIIYRVLPRQVVIMLIADGRRDMRSLLEQRLLR